jgi:GNAT superfamily N-acetyltransferase
MTETTIDPRIPHAWLAARSIARGLPAPVADHGGYRVDTNSDAEVRRWVFPQVGAGLAELARTIDAPRHFLKLCGDAGALRAVLSDRWQLHDPGYFMTATEAPVERPLAAGYRIETARIGAVVEVRLTSSAGDLAASGYAAETGDAFIYDRIVTAPAHRRKGLGKAVMAALHRARQNQDTPQLLVATEEGRALYLTLGWRVLSPFSTASIADVDIDK